MGRAIEAFEASPDVSPFSSKFDAFLARKAKLSAENGNTAWHALASTFDGRFRTVTIRNVDKRPYATFVKAYTQNGYFKSLKEIVHFYNTRDTLPHCATGSPGEGVTCWPTPEFPRNLNTHCCDLGLSPQQEDDLVAFLRTLTDGYFTPSTVTAGAP